MKTALDEIQQSYTPCVFSRYKVQIRKVEEHREKSEMITAEMLTMSVFERFHVRRFNEFQPFK